MLVEPSRLATPHEYAPLPVRRSRNVTVGVLFWRSPESNGKMLTCNRRVRRPKAAV